MASIWLYDRGFNLSADQPNIEAAMSLHKAQLNPAIFGLNSIIKCQLETLTVVWYLDPWGPIWGCIFHFRFHMEMGHHPWIPQGFQHATLTLLINALAHLSSAAPREPWADLAVQSFYGVNGSMGNQWELRIEFPHANDHMVVIEIWKVLYD